MHRLGTLITIATFAVVTAGAAAPAFAQDAGRGEIGAQVSTLSISEFDTTAVGAGVQAGWRLTPGLTIEGALNIYPGGDGTPIEDQRKLLGVVGVRTGVSFGGLELVARARPGFLNFAEQANVPCILIFPTPLSCRVASGYTAFVTELGGGVRVPLGSNRLQLTVDVSDLLVRYSSDEEFLRMNGDARDITDSVLSHNLLFNAGVNWRF